MLYSKRNFFLDSFAVWSPKTHSKLLNKYKPHYVSESGSKYWYSKKGVYRYSNHWGEVGSCIWIRKNRCYGRYYSLLFCKWEDFKEVLVCETKKQYNKLLRKKVRFYLFGRRIRKSTIEMFESDGECFWRTTKHPNHYGNNFIVYTF